MEEKACRIQGPLKQPVLKELRLGRKKKQRKTNLFILIIDQANQACCEGQGCKPTLNGVKYKQKTDYNEAMKLNLASKDSITLHQVSSPQYVWFLSCKSRERENLFRCFLVIPPILLYLTEKKLSSQTILDVPQCLFKEYILIRINTLPSQQDFTLRCILNIYFNLGSLFGYCKGIIIARLQRTGLLF